MSHVSLLQEIEQWLIHEALGDPDIATLFGKLCDRLRGIGIPLERVALSWPTLHPLFRAEQAFWYPETGANLEQYYHATAQSEPWLKSPFYHMLTHDLAMLRRRLTGSGAVIDFEVLEDFQAEGYSDYLLTATSFHIADTTTFSGGRSGIMSSWMTKREAGFTDDDIGALQRIQAAFAIACRASIQRRVMDNIATAYLGPTAGKRVLGGDIRLGDGSRIRAVVWFSDLRASTRLSDTMDADSYLALLNRYFACTAGPVIEQGGEILNFIGDGVLAIFPIGEDDVAAAASRAEAAVHRAISLRDDALAAGTPGNAPLDFGIGLAIGDVMFGNIGVPERLAFSAIGKVVNTVTRVEAATKTLGWPVLALESFTTLAPGDWIEAGEIDIADFDRKVEVFVPGVIHARGPRKLQPIHSLSVSAT